MTDRRAGVAAALRRAADELESAGAAQIGERFTDVSEADSFVKEHPEAFLVGALFTQGIPAERAWAGPYRLSERLGHFDLGRLATEREAVDEAFCAPPALHRFKHTVAGWVSDAAALLLEQYGGDASRIWSGGRTVAETGERLSAFPGIGRKKAAMSIEILRRHFGVGFASLEEGSVAYDVHVRRVFLRSGLVEKDTPAEVAAAARAAHPRAPGSLDLAAWIVGRRWCRPRRPACEECALCEACPRRTWLTVEGVGTRGNESAARRVNGRAGQSSRRLKSSPDRSFG